MASDWKVDSWKQKTVVQDVAYLDEDQNDLKRVLSKLNHLPPLVSEKEVT
jgi:3-deoxy-7-phosphoheptulonate synthase